MPTLQCQIQTGCIGGQTRTEVEHGCPLQSKARHICTLLVPAQQHVYAHSPTFKTKVPQVKTRKDKMEQGKPVKTARNSGQSGAWRCGGQGCGRRRRAWTPACPATPLSRSTLPRASSCGTTAPALGPRAPLQQSVQPREPQ